MFLCVCMQHSAHMVIGRQLLGINNLLPHGSSGVLSSLLKDSIVEDFYICVLELCDFIGLCTKYFFALSKTALKTAAFS